MAYKSKKYPRGFGVRIGLTEAEYNQLKKISEWSGVSLSRLMADAVRQVHLAKKAA